MPDVLLIANQIDALLGQQPDQPEYWSEFGLPQASVLTPSLTPAAWESLVRHWPTRSTEWKSRLLALAACRGVAECVRVLQLSFDDPPLLVRALESLCDFDPANVIHCLSASDVARIRHTAAKLNGVEKTAAEHAIRYIRI